MDDKILATFHCYDHDDIALFANAADMQRELSDFYHWLRNQHKHGEDMISTEKVWVQFHEYMGKYLD
jgi:hypothetical protein